MSIMESEIQWFIARDGRQHGPVSDLEMRKLVELGHLRPTDLIWRQGFPDWRPAPAVFQPQAQFSPYGTDRLSASSSSAQRSRVAMQSTAPRFEPATGRPAAGLRSSVPSPGYGIARDPNVSVTAGRRAAAQSQQEAGQAASSFSHAQQTNKGKSPSRGRRALGLLFLLLLLAGAGWLAHENLDRLKQLAGKPVADAAPAPQAATVTLAPPAVAAKVADFAALDTKLQQQVHWKIVKQEFPDWYKNRLAEAGRLEQQGKSATEISQYLAEGLVELRRSNADRALSASTQSLKAMAAAFQANIKRLSQESTDTCMAFILKGEGSPAVVQLSEDSQKNAEINSHFTAIFNAIAEGGKAGAKHADPTDADYQLLVAQLVKLGWSQADLQLFADPKGASRTPPERYCTMMHNFFGAHLEIKDPAAQERLLFRTLKLVVAG